MEKLSDKQELFCREYLIDLNATQAAIRAGYSARSANQMASQNLAKHGIQERLAELKAERNERVNINADYVLIQAVKLHERCMQEVRPKRLKGEAVCDKDGNAVYEFNAAGAAKALEIIGKHVDVQAFRESVEVRADLSNRVQESPLNELPVEKLKLIREMIHGE